MRGVIFRSTLAALVVALAAWTPPVAGQSFAVVPEANEDTRGTAGTNTLVRDSGLPRTYQMQFPASHLAAQGLTPGQTVTGLTWRAQPLESNPPEWPPAGGATWQDYEVTLAQAAHPIDEMSTTFADNMTDPVLVRSGELFIPEGVFKDESPVAPDPNPWGFEVTFAPYTYQGGDLVVLVSHVGSDIGSNIFLDAVASSDGDGRAQGALTFQAATALGVSDLTITRLSFAPSQELEPPASVLEIPTTSQLGLLLMLLLLAAAGLWIVRR